MSFVKLSDLKSKEFFKGFNGRAIHTGTMSFMYWSVLQGAEVPLHSHPHQQVAQVLQGRFQLTVDGNTQVLEPGIIAVIPANVPHGGTALTPCELLDVFQPEREDYKFD
ncbi:MAG: cupin domain-containing protein [Flavisolibacter sp.]